jgi:hypothetical protein
MQSIWPWLALAAVVVVALVLMIRLGVHSID